MEEKKTGKVHGLTLKERKYGKLTGVQDIHSFNENEILLQTEAGKVQIKGEQLYQIGNTAFCSRFRNRSRDACCLQADRYAEKTFVLRQNVEQYSGYFVLVIGWFAAFYRFISVQLWQNPLFYAGRCCFWWNFCKFCVK